jgi:enoyl-CoA hydratase
MIRTERHEQVTLLRIDRHAQRNALNPAHLADLLHGLEQAVESGSRCIVITGNGSSFCSGADLDVVRDEGFLGDLYGFLHRLAELPVPVIAAVNGPAIGAGTQLALACDLRVAAPTARFAIPTARLGLSVDAWTVRRLAALAGGGAARAILIGVDTLDADRAYGSGLVDRLGDLDDALAWAQEIASLAPLTLAYNKLALNAVAELNPVDERIDKAMTACWNSADAAEGQRARAERRPPSFLGR